MPNKKRCATCKSGCTRSAKLDYRLDQVQLVLLRLASTKFRVNQDEPPKFRVKEDEPDFERREGHEASE
jgi:hypothetical protein